jgi:NAD(P)-dependent dehydrogenase (short-subunit alcohol dehydrogenase family)
MASRVLITGAASGIGAATAECLRSAGARVIGLDLQADGQDVLSCDVRDQRSVGEAVQEAIGRLGGLDALVNNAGLGLPQRASRPPEEDALAVIDVNLLGPWRVTGAAMDALRASRGRVVNVASGLAHFAVPLAPAYCMSKRGLTAYSDALRYEVGHEVTVTTVYPGYVRTPIHTASQEQGFALEGMVPAEPLRKVAASIADAVLGAPRRDVATTRAGALGYAVVRRLPRRTVDRLVMSRVRLQARSGAGADSALAGDLMRALRR